MDPSRKRRIRLVVALGAAVCLAVALLYTSFDTATRAQSPSQVLASGGARTSKLTGRVVPGSIRHDGAKLVFRIRDRVGAATVPVTYTGLVPDPFRDGREVVLTGRLSRGTFVGERDTLVTKCPSKFKSKPGGKTV